MKKVRSEEGAEERTSGDSKNGDSEVGEGRVLMVGGHTQTHKERAWFPTCLEVCCGCAPDCQLLGMSTIKGCINNESIIDKLSKQRCSVSRISRAL